VHSAPRPTSWELPHGNGNEHGGASVFQVRTMDVSVQESFRALTRCMYELLEVNDEEMLSFEAVFAQISKVDPTLVTSLGLPTAQFAFQKASAGVLLRALRPAVDAPLSFRVWTCIVACARGRSPESEARPRTKPQGSVANDCSCRFARGLHALLLLRRECYDSFPHFVQLQQTTQMLLRKSLPKERRQVCAPRFARLCALCTSRCVCALCALVL
jgi:hypothetical protein